MKKEKKAVPRLKDEEQLSAITSADEKGDAEAKSLGRGKSEDELKKEAEQNEHNRKENFRNHIERIAICGIYAGALFFALISTALIVHYVFPSNSWLTPTEAADLKTLITGGIVASVITGYFKKRL